MDRWADSLTGVLGCTYKPMKKRLDKHFAKMKIVLFKVSLIMESTVVMSRLIANELSPMNYRYLIKTRGEKMLATPHSIPFYSKSSFDRFSIIF